ncbi:hypothetical protein TWF106_005913 [Orbilia oligospora]|uniref:Uncharacterized protein n=1 Tax=Orbilia oligospora TaxID=2813651 RepID=A0A7C8U7X4_ORBOL|nr:hypothetical protein TWF106_005913 [Orbilia oligospora]
MRLRLCFERNPFGSHDSGGGKRAGWCRCVRDEPGPRRMMEYTYTAQREAKDTDGDDIRSKEETEQRKEVRLSLYFNQVSPKIHEGKGCKPRFARLEDLETREGTWPASQLLNLTVPISIY